MTHMHLEVFSVSDFRDYCDSYYFRDSCMFSSFAYENKDTSGKNVSLT